MMISFTTLESTVFKCGYMLVVHTDVCRYEWMDGVRMMMCVHMLQICLGMYVCMCDSD